MCAKISAPVSIEAVRSALGLPGACLATLCAGAHGRTLRWASRKPVRFAAMRPLSADEWRTADHGLRPPSGAVAGGAFDPAWRRLLWDYAAPRGGADEPFRLSDWEGYATDASAPVATPGTLRIGPLDTSGTLRFSFGRGFLGIVGNDTLGLSDFGTLADYYPCVAIGFTGHDGTAYTRIITASSTIGSGATSVSVPISTLRGFSTDRLTYFMCGCSAVQTALGVPPSARYIVLPSDAPLEGEILVSDSLPLVVSFDRVQAGTLGGALLFHGKEVAQYNPMGTIIPYPGGNFDPDAGTTTDAYKYLNVGTRATVAFKTTFKNFGSTSLRIPRTSLYCRVVRNLAGATTPVMSIDALREFDGSIMKAADAITLSAGQSKQYAIGWTEYACVRNAAGTVVNLPDTRTFNAAFMLYADSSGATTLGSSALNISNYNT